MSTNMAGSRWFSKIISLLSLDESSLSIGRVVILSGELLLLDFGISSIKTILDTDIILH